MDQAIEYVKQKQYDNTIIATLNSVRLYQKILLPYELVSMQGKIKTSSFNNIEVECQIRWNFKIPNTKRPYASVKKEQQKFITQLIQQDICIIQDFKEKCRMKYYISLTHEFLREDNSKIY